jgi:hypothetical protein
MCPWCWRINSRGEGIHVDVDDFPLARRKGRRIVVFGDHVAGSATLTPA